MRILKDNYICCFCGNVIDIEDTMISVSFSLNCKDKSYEIVEQILFSHVSCAKKIIHKDIPFYLESLIDD